MDTTMAEVDAIMDSPETKAQLKVARSERFAHRIDNIRQMRSQTRQIIFFMALMEGLRHGPVQMVFAGKEGYDAPGAEDFGIAYWSAYMLSYVYVCVFMIFFVPLFSVSTSPDFSQTNSA